MLRLLFIAIFFNFFFLDSGVIPINDYGISNLMESNQYQFNRQFVVNGVELKPFGYVRFESYVDSRQVLAFIDGVELVSPKPKKPDKFCRDINKAGSLNMAAMLSVFGCTFETSCWRGNSKIKGDFQLDFRGNMTSNIGELRLRLGYFIIESGDWSLRFGRYWDPIFVPQCYPNTVSFNSGEPLDPPFWDDQFFICKQFDGNHEFCVYGASEVVDISTGPDGETTKYWRNALIPSLGWRWTISNKKDDIFGLGMTYKRLVPRISTEKDFKVNESINSVAIQLFAAHVYAPFSFRTKLIFLQNGPYLGMLGGYGVHSRNSITDRQTYTNLAAIAGWIDASYILPCNNRELGFFIGAGKNLGSRNSLFFDPLTREPIIFELFKQLANLSYMVRFSPRYVYARDPFRFGIEMELTRAAFGKIGPFGRISDAFPVTNLRLTALFLFMF